MKEKINKDFIVAFKAKEIDKKTFLGVLKGEIALAESRPDFNDKTVDTILRKMEKSLKSAIAAGDKSAEQELKWLSVYLPQLMSESEITEIVKQLIVNGANNIGQVMGQFNKNFKGQADNNIVKNVALKLL
jgi:uncharacterized protein YqeY